MALRLCSLPGSLGRAASGLGLGSIKLLSRSSLHAGTRTAALALWTRRRISASGLPCSDSLVLGYSSWIAAAFARIFKLDSVRTALLQSMCTIREIPDPAGSFSFEQPVVCSSLREQPTDRVHRQPVQTVSHTWHLHRGRAGCLGPRLLLTARTPRRTTGHGACT